MENDAAAVVQRRIPDIAKRVVRAKHARTAETAVGAIAATGSGGDAVAGAVKCATTTRRAEGKRIALRHAEPDSGSVVRSYDTWHRAEARRSGPEGAVAGGRQRPAADAIACTERHP